MKFISKIRPSKALLLVLLFSAVKSAWGIETINRSAGGETISGYLKVTDGIFRGGRPTANDLAAIKAQDKILTVIDLEDDTQAVSQENASAIKLNMHFLPTPMDAFGNPTDAEIDTVLSELQNSKNLPAFIHCHYGEDRTGLLIGIYRVEVQHWPPDQAYQEMLANGFHPILRGLDQYFRQRTGYNGN